LFTTSHQNPRGLLSGNNFLRPVAALLLMCLTALPLVAGTPSLFDAFNAKLAKTNSFSSHFVQDYYDSLQDKTSRTVGEFAYKRPGLMKWSYAEPDELQIIVGSNKVWIVDPILENVTIQNIDQVSRIKTLAFLMEENNLSNHFIVTSVSKKILKTSKEWSVLYLKPRKGDPFITELQIAIDKKNHFISQFVVVDAHMNYRKIVFTKPQFNQKFRDQEFEFLVPENMDVIDGLDN